eukprot:11524905-Alexandrium_andersonii.AAC.1
MGLSEETAAAIDAAFARLGAMDEAGVPATLKDRVHEANRANWFSVQGIAALTNVRRGVMPGDPLGDILFTM